MKQMHAVLALIILLAAAGPLGARSLWDSGYSVYKLTLRSNDLVHIRFSDKTLLKYQTEQKLNNYQKIQGKKGAGEMFSFFPGAEVGQSDTVKNQNNLSIKQENRLTLPARVTWLDGYQAALSGQNRMLVNGELFLMEFSGEFDTRDLTPDLTLDSTELYNLNFTLENRQPTNQLSMSDQDLIYTTNYNDIRTNFVVDTTNNVTNTEVLTNPAAITLELKGLTDEKKREVVRTYLNMILNTLFR